ncbi:HPr family phosphocarrier protein [Mesorhizobium sanjuanii]|uniref:HPr family phosphocarrier protein n=1 Tax=Mesorhizobium sanjuanii TaxID=2037900 RepID=A0A2A6FFX7_9HYPH|nr:HPr family phosphocarrier protein [Mesorhizobium sanjuanii]PDQ20849.1 HPr family phosphocarrier protein [Mesorhizobium sanjuanii]
MNALSSEKVEIVRDFPIVNQRGLHARASAKFVQVASGFNATVHVEKDGVKVGGTSIMGLMMLAASPGFSIRVTASGPQAAEVIDALEQLVASRFGEEA